MAKVTVYNFEVYDNGEMKRASRAATRTAIECDLSTGYKILEETAQEVDESKLDDNGFYPRSENLYSDQPPKR
jgi:hypothetical protein